MEQSLPKAMTNTMLLFSTPVYLFNDYIGSDIHNTHSEQQKVVKNQEGNFSSKETNILELESYKVIKDRILHGLDEYINDVMRIDTDKHEFYITQSWLNINPPGTSHHRHNHSNSVISGVYYIDTTEDNSITFSSQNQTNVTSLPMLKIDVKEYNITNSNSWNIPVPTNSIIYFPSSTLHEVSPNESNQNRISLAFNVFVKGNFGNEANLNQLKL
ncbi:TIGR02466 family protein [bacterium]|nr:TIGR02466 family protein [bacterium]|tara:strand:- start:8841 stop:9485 length:645 start_codon:yes stop_codon:yes gene_type:complete